MSVQTEIWYRIQGCGRMLVSEQGETTCVAGGCARSTGTREKLSSDRERERGGNYLEIQKTDIDKRCVQSDAEL